MIRLFAILLVAAAAQRDAPEDWQAHRDAKSGIEFLYPSVFRLQVLRDPQDVMVSARIRSERIEIRVTLKDVRGYPSGTFGPGDPSFEVFALAVARLMCDADGPDGSRSCPETVKKRAFVNSHGLECLEIQLEEIVESHDPVRRVSRIREPLYAVKIPGPRLGRVLFLELAEEEPLPPEAGGILGRMAGSVRGVP